MVAELPYPSGQDSIPDRSDRTAFEYTSPSFPIVPDSPDTSSVPSAVASSSRKTGPFPNDDLNHLSEDELVQALHEAVGIYPNKQPGPSWRLRDKPTEYARRVWSIYHRLSLFTKQSLSRSTFLRLVQAVAHVNELRIKTSQTPRNEKVRMRLDLAERWGSRLAAILADLRMAHGVKATHLEAYKHALEMLALVGDVRQVENIYREMARISEPDDFRGEKFTTFRLMALSRRLRDQELAPKMKGHWRRTENDTEGIEVLWSVLREFRDTKRSPDTYQALKLVECISLIRGPSVDESTSRLLDNMLEELFAKVFGVNMKDFSIEEADRHAFVDGSVLNALLDYIGRKGDMWRMISVFETLTNPELVEEPVPPVWDVELPSSTLRSQIAEVPRNLAASFRELDWASLRVRQAREPERPTPVSQYDEPFRLDRTYDDFYPSPPTPLEIAVSPTSVGDGFQPYMEEYFPSGTFGIKGRICTSCG